MAMFSVPMQWDEGYLDMLVRNRQRIAYVYGKLRSDPIGGGRSSLMMPYVARKEAAAAIRSLKSRGIEFNYLFNATCLQDVEFSSSGKKKLRPLFDFLMRCGAGSVTVVSPYLLEFSKREYPGLKVHVSTFAGVNSLTRAKYWESMGADTITLCLCSRDIAELKRIRQGVGCKVQLICNQSCLHQCPFMASHTNYTSHHSRQETRRGSQWVDYWFINCLVWKLKDHSQIIKAPWIRPEDVRHYEGLGIDSFKIAGRNLSAQRLTRVVEAYLAGSFEGNLLSLFPDSLESSPGKFVYWKGMNKALFMAEALFFSPFSEVRAMMKASRELRWLRQNLEVSIDNKSLEGFLDFFLKNGGCSQDCARCGYCAGVAKASVKSNAAAEREGVRRMQELLSAV